ncbi:MAG: hypothetical protein AAB403_20255 [Planctomycetota bacterium]
MAEAAPDEGSTLYSTPAQAMTALDVAYKSWTRRLTETSLQLSYAVLAANWAVFGSVDNIVQNAFARWSVALVVITLASNVAVAGWLGRTHKALIDSAQAKPAEWAERFRETAKAKNAFPFTEEIEKTAGALRVAKVWLPLAAGAAFIAALFH